jgi:HK97 family phage major capsid protein
MVMPEFGGVKKGQIFETSPIRQLATTVSISTDVYEYVIDDDQLGAVEWIGEVTAASETSTPNVGLGQIATHQMAVEPKISQKLLDDAMVNVDQWLVDKINDRFTRGENTAFVSGDGANKPKGFLSYSAWAVAGTYERNKIEQINSGSAGAVTADGIKDLVSGLKEAYQPNAVFLMKRATFGAVTKLKDGTGSYLLNVDSPREGDALRMGGKSVLFADDMQAIASDALAIAYGDFRAGYTIVDRIGVRVMRDMYTGKPFVKFYATKRVGGAVTNFEAIKLQKLAA